MMKGTSQQVRGAMERKSTKELLAIWKDRDTGESTTEALEILRLVLLERGVDPEDLTTTEFVTATSDDLSTTSNATRLLCAAAHLHHDKIYRPLRERFGSPDNFRADTPEYFVDLEAVRREASVAHRRETLRRWLVASVAAFGLSLAAAGRFGSLIGVVGVLVLIELLTELARQRYVRSTFLGQTPAPSANNGSGSSARQNVVISGGFSPFVGAGNDVLGWSFAIDPNKSSGEDAPKALDPKDLYEEVAGNLNGLGIEGLVVSDKVFVHGEEIRHEKLILPNVLAKPRTTVPEYAVRQAVGVGQNRLRHYRLVQVPAWGGELVLSVFMRFTTIGTRLFVEARFFLLTPLRAEFRSVENLTSTITLRQLAVILTASIVKAPFTWIEAAFAGVTSVERFFIGLRSEESKLAKENERYNYGWTRSLREEWSGTGYERYFQLLDKDMYSKLLQAGIIDALVCSLEARGISTEAIKDQATTIVNYGLLVSGGKVEASNLAIGRKAVATLQQAVDRRTNAGL